MGKKTVLAFSLSLLVIIGYNYFISQKYPPPSRESVLVQKQKKETFFSPVVSEPQSEQKSALLAQPAKQTKDFIVETDLVKLVITASGARIKSCQLKEYPEERLDLKSVQTQISQLERALASASSEAREFLHREKSKQEVLLKKLEQRTDGAELVSLAATIHADFSPTIIFLDEEDVGLALNTAVYQCPQDVLILNEGRPKGQLEFTYIDSLGRKIKKVYSFSNSNYGIWLDVSFPGWQKKDLAGDYFLLSYGPDVGLPQVQQGRRGYGYIGPVSCFQSGQQNWTQREKYARHEKNIFVRREHKNEGRVLWTGLENKYFLTALIPGQPVESVVVEKNRFGEQKAALTVPWKGPGPYNFQLYLGPKKDERLKEVDVTLGKSIDYGFFGPIARFIYQTLVFFSRWTNNFGWAIVLLCLLTKIVFYPLTHRSFESMQKMQHQMKTIQPEMTALREKFRDNSQKLNKEIMELYRKKGVNPLSSCQSGCLPLILQMPIFFALYGVLYNSIELRQTPFLGWITDLSTKDPCYVLPILMGISMFVQQKLTGLGEATGAQQQQAKMMSVFMPLFLTWIFASLPSGVVLYWLTFNIATALQQLLIRRKQEAATAA